LKGEQTSRANQLRQGSQNGNRVGKKRKDVPAHSGVEWFIAWNLGYVARREGHIAQASLSHSFSRPANRAGVAFYASDLTRGTNKPGQQQGDISDAGSQIEHTITWADARFAEASFRVKIHPLCLSN